MAQADPFVLLAAGGTGGHLFPAEALAHALAARGVACELATDSRAAQYAKDFPARAVHALPSATPSGGTIFSKVSAGVTLMRGALKARGLIARHRPAAVVGFGGYPCVPPVIAAVQKNVPTILHEQNGVLGRANAFLAARVTAIATGFPDVRGITPTLADKTTHIGNPVRPAVLAAVAPFIAME
ncbi:MAG: UDP-N-acetylglucosamine--N-acetylmuramyl-(pentapeptide) pyrophosphoryl-undecaprenol N-acetylglucosamine transferase, partial [Beijerinckiaceae bacterium]